MSILEKELSKFGKGHQYPIEERESLVEDITKGWIEASKTDDLIERAGCELTIEAVFSCIMKHAADEWMRLDIDHNEPANMFVGNYVQFGNFDAEVLGPIVKNFLFKDEAIFDWRRRNRPQDRRIALIALLCRLNDWVFDTRMIPFVKENLEALLLINSK